MSRTGSFVIGIACLFTADLVTAQSPEAEDATTRLERLLEEYEFTTPRNYEPGTDERKPLREAEPPRERNWQLNFEETQQPPQQGYENPFGDVSPSFDAAVETSPRKIPIINEEGEILMPVDRQDIITERERPTLPQQPLPENARAVKPLPVVTISKGIDHATVQLLNRISLNNEQMTLRTKGQEVGEFDMLELEVLGCVIEPRSGIDRAMALVNIRERVPNLRFTPDGQTQKSERVETIYAGWLISDVPYVSGPSHAVYDVTLKGCS